MTERYLGSIITANPVEPSANTENSAASGVWNVHDPLIFGQASDWPDPSVPNPDKFVENLFSCFVYDGNGSTQTITNDIDLSNEGGLVWIKSRDNSNLPFLFDTERGVQKYLISSATDVQGTSSTSVTSFNSNGFSLGSLSDVNNNNQSTISWTFRKQPKFFDVVTYTGNDTAGRTVSHNLGSVPGMIIIKCTSVAHPWPVFHRGITDAEDKIVKLNKTDAAGNAYTHWNRTEPTATEFTLGTEAEVNQNGATYVAYLFAHNNNDGGFGSTGDQDIIKCGSYTGNASSNGPEIDLGFEPQWLLIKSAENDTRWVILDNIRGLADGSTPTLLPNANSAEASEALLKPTSTGFKILDADTSVNASGSKIIYVAIRRGPMITPTAGTQVFFPDLITANQSGITATGIGFSPDVIINLVRSNANYGQQICNRLTGPKKQLFTNYNSAEGTTNGTALVSFDMDGYTLGADTAGTGWNAYSGYTSVKHCFKRAPGFLDVVAYTGTGSTLNLNHNLGVTPEMILVKNRDSARDWQVYHDDVYGSGGTDYVLTLNSSVAQEDLSIFDSPTATQFTVKSSLATVNTSGDDYIAFLFATVAGVSKVGTYSGTGSDVNVDCGFTSGARFVLAKRVDSSGDWYVWDSERGIVAGNDPYLLISGAAAEVTNTDYIDPLSSGFTITSNAGSDLNTSGGTYLFLAIA